MKKLMLLSLLAFAISGCAMFDGLQDTAAEKLVPIAEEYCANTDAAFRADFRAKFNEQFSGTVIITCPE